MLTISLSRPIAEDQVVETKRRKRLALYQRSPDGSVKKEFISYDDPRLAMVSNGAFSLIVNSALTKCAGANDHRGRS